MGRVFTLAFAPQYRYAGHKFSNEHPGLTGASPRSGPAGLLISIGSL